MIRRAPETPAASSVSLALAIEGMTCASCVARVETALRDVPGVADAAVNLTTGLASVTAHPADPSALTASLLQAVSRAGYHATALSAGGGSAQALRDVAQRSRHHESAVKHRLLVGVLAAIPILLIDLLHTRLMRIHSGAGLIALMLAQTLLATVVVAFTGGIFFRNAWRAGRHPTMDTLVALGSGTAYLYSLFLVGLWGVPLLGAPSSVRLMHETVAMLPHTEFHAAVVIIVLVTVGKYLEARAKRAANNAVAGLAQQTAPTATLLLLDGSAKTVPAEQVVPGDRLQVLAHQIVPVDGELLDGAGSLDASIVTGESTPIDLHAPAAIPTLVPGGATLLDGRILLRATSTAATSAVARILQLVQNAQASKTRIQALADRVAAVFTPVVLALAALTFFGWLLLASPAPAWNAALVAAIAVIVIACPCAMGLATPTALTVATGRAARLGILFTNAAALETAGRITWRRSDSPHDALLFDKTGTLTTGQLHLVDALPSPDVPHLSPQALLTLAASIEQFSTHPLAQAIVARAQADKLTLAEPDSFSSIPGGGVRAEVGGRTYALGSLAFMRSSGVDTVPLAPAIARLQDQGATLVLLAELNASANAPPASSTGRPLGLLALRDQLRPDAADTLLRLHDAGFRIGVLSGDAAPAVRGALHDLPVDFLLASVPPEAKAQRVAALRQENEESRARGKGMMKGRRENGGIVVFVGDGVNDAPALAAADLGITLATGTDLAKAAGDVILVSGKLASIPQTLALAHATLRIIRQNLFWAFFYNILALPLAALGILPPVAAAGAMVLSSLSVVMNALRLQWLPLTQPSPRRDLPAPG